MNDLKKYFYLWKDTLLKPDKTLKSEGKKASWEKYTKNLVIAGLISGAIIGLGNAIGVSETLFNTVGRITVFIANLFLWPLLLIIGNILSSGLYYIIALLLGGKGKFSEQTYLISLYSAPLSIISSIFLFIMNISVLLAPLLLVFILVLSVYSLYLLTLVLRQTHKFTTGKAIMTWLLPVIIILLIIALLIVTFADLFTSFATV